MKKSMVRAAKGEVPADLVLKNGKVLNVFSEEILTCDVAGGLSDWEAMKATKRLTVQGSTSLRG